MENKLLLERSKIPGAPSFGNSDNDSFLRAPPTFICIAKPFPFPPHSAHLPSTSQMSIFKEKRHCLPAAVAKVVQQARGEVGDGGGDAGRVAGPFHAVEFNGNLPAERYQGQAPGSIRYLMGPTTKDGQRD